MYWRPGTVLSSAALLLWAHGCGIKAGQGTRDAGARASQSGNGDVETNEFGGKQPGDGTMQPDDPNDPDEPSVPGTPVNPNPMPGPAPMASGSILWQSTAWSNGKMRSITAAHDFDPDDPKVELAAGESRRLTFHGDGTVTLEGNRSRIYIHGNHRDAELVFEANATDSKLENISTKLRSRHNEDGAPENRFGGYGVAFNLKSQSADFQIELYHNEHEGGKKFKLARPLEYNKWYRYKVTIETVDNDAKATLRAFIDYDMNGQWTEVGTETYERTGYLKNDLNALYCWIRANSGNAVQTGLKLRNGVFSSLTTATAR